jgi:quinol monooxygenase YgiN
MTVGIFRQLQIQPGRRDEYLALLEPLCRHVEHEAGTVVYLVHTDREAPDSIWLYCRFSDRTALAAHLASDTYLQVYAKANALIASMEDLDVDLIGNKGIPGEPNGLLGARR